MCSTKKQNLVQNIQTFLKNCDFRVGAFYFDAPCSFAISSINTASLHLKLVLLFNFQRNDAEVGRYGVHCLACYRQTKQEVRPMLSQWLITLFSPCIGEWMSADGDFLSGRNVGTRWSTWRARCTYGVHVVCEVCLRDSAETEWRQWRSKTHSLARPFSPIHSLFMTPLSPST